MEPQLGTIADDLLVGAEAIALEAFGSEKHKRRVYHLAERGELPVFYLGSLIAARKSTLRQHIAEREAAYAARFTTTRRAS